MPIINFINKTELDIPISSLPGDLSVSGRIYSSGERVATIEDMGLNITVNGRFGWPVPVFIAPVNYTQITTTGSAPAIGPVQTNAALWIESFDYNPTIIGGTDTTLTGVSFNNLFGVKSTFAMGTCNSLTGLNLPQLSTVIGNFSPSTLPALTGFSVPQLTTVGGNFSPNNMAELTGFSVPLLTTVGGNFQPNTMNALTGFSVPQLTTVGGTFNPSTMAALTGFSVPQLTTVGGAFNPNTMNALTGFSVPQLTTVGGNFSPSTMTALTGFSAPQLTTVGGAFQPGGLTALTSISMPQLSTVGANLTCTNMNNLVSLNLPQLSRIGANINMPTTSVPALSGFSLPSITGIVGAIAITPTAGRFSGLFFGTGLRNVGGNVTITNQRLILPSVENILIRLAALNGTAGTTVYGAGRTVNLSGGTSAGVAALGSAASGARATLLARTVTVTMNA
jgi:hypothetical protein